MRGCLGQILTWGLILAVALWVLKYPESVAGLVGTGLDLVVAGADSLGRLMNALVGEVNGLI